MTLSISRSRILGAFVLPLTVALCAWPGHAQELVVTAAKPGGVYAIGDKISWQVSVKGEGAAEVKTVSYTVRKGGLSPLSNGELTLTDGVATLDTKLDEPGTLLADFRATVTGKPGLKALAGAVIAPEKIGPSAPRPADFDAFWKEKIAELQAVPANPVLETAESGKEGVSYSKITLDNIRGTKIQGQVARPAQATNKLPALLIVQWAGVYPLNKEWVTGQAAKGWLALNINAHDLPIDSPAEFYKEQSANALKGYPAIGNDDREKSYFLRMYLSCYRAADYLASREDWDGKTLVVMGGSQGGLQAIMTGGLHPKVSAVLANVPAGCDHTGPLVGRAGGWPMWYNHSRGKEPELAAKIIETSKYFDVVNFAQNVRVPSLIAAGVIDVTCPPAGIAAAANQIQGPKEVLYMELAEHGDKNGSHGQYYRRSGAWLDTMVKGGAAPVLGSAGGGFAGDG